MAKATARSLKPEKMAIFSILFRDEINRGTRTKIRIIEATTSLISQIGYFKLTFEKIGLASQLTKTQVRYHFKTIDEIIMLAFKSSVLTNQTITVNYLTEINDWWHQIQAYCQANFFWAQRYPEQAKLSQLVFHLATLRPDWQNMLEKVFRTGRLRFQECLGQAHPQLTLPQATELAETIHTCIVGFLLSRLHENKPQMKTLHRSCLNLIVALLKQRRLLTEDQCKSLIFL